MAIHDRPTLEGLEQPRRRLPPVPAPGGVARAGGAGEAGLLPRRGVLGTSAARLRRPPGGGVRARPGAGRARRQPHGARLHRRPLGRLVVRLHAPDRIRQSAHLGPSRRRPAARRGVGDRRGALRPAGQQAAAGRTRQLPALRRRGAGAAGAGGDRVSGRLRVGRRLPPARSATQTALRPRCRVRSRGGRARCCSAATTRASRTPSPAS